MEWGIRHTAAPLLDVIVNDKDPSSPGTSTINATGPNIRFGAISSTGTTTGTAFTLVDPKIGALANNGGPTQTFAPFTGSPAINAGASARGSATDQRGLPRKSGPAADLGSVEVQVPGPLLVSGAVDGSALSFTPNAAGQYSAGAGATRQGLSHPGRADRVQGSQRLRLRRPQRRRVRGLRSAGGVMNLNSAHQGGCPLVWQRRQKETPFESCVRLGLWGGASRRGTGLPGGPHRGVPLLQVGDAVFLLIAQPHHVQLPDAISLRAVEQPLAVA